MQPSLDVLRPSIQIERLTSRVNDRVNLHARGLAEVATGRIDAAVSDLRLAVATAGPPDPTLRSDLAAVLLERGRSQDEPIDFVDALNESAIAARDGTLPAALFNKALALETLGPRALAIDAWHSYLSADRTSSWADEARSRITALQVGPIDSRIETTALFHRLERELLPAWARQTLAGAVPDVKPLAAAVDAIASVSTDREVIDIARHAMSPAASPRIRTCLARAVISMDGWLDAYNRVVQADAEEAAESAAGDLECAHLPTIGARLRGMLVRDRNAAYAPLDALANEAVNHGYTRIASLARIARGNSGMRRSELTSGMADLQLARTLAYAAGDLELTATADAMMADGYMQLGDPASAWRFLRMALENLPAAVNVRFVYSIVRAAAAAALDDGHSAASLPYSTLLIDATAGWNQPGARILSNVDRALAFQTTGQLVDALAAIDDAEKLLPTQTDHSARAELAAEIELARGHLTAQSIPDTAIPLLSDALAFFETKQTRVRMASVLLERGRAYRARGEIRSARADWERAASLIEDQQPNVREEQLRISRWNALWDVFAELLRSDSDDPSKALATSERAHARELLDSLAPQQRATPLAGPTLWAWLPAESTAVVYSVLPEKLLVWTVDRTGPRLRMESVGADALNVMVRRVTNAIREGRDDESGDLSRLLLAGLPARSPGTTLLIVPDGSLNLLPFAALKIPGTDAHLVERWTPIIAPSLSVARSLAGRPHPGRMTGRVLLAGYDAVGEPALPRLPGVGRELKTLGDIYGQSDVLEGPEATIEAFRHFAADSAVIHVAAHGIVNMAYPSRSYILLAPGRDRGALDPSRIAAMSLRQSPVVVLSACDSAVGRVYRGEGSLSLARAFLAAGASSVIAAEYEVDDTAVLQLQTDLHSRLRNGESGAMALAASQMRAIRLGSSVRDWAAFAAIGGID